MKKLYMLLALLAIAVTSTTAQSYKITGSVKDSIDTYLVSATVVALSEADSTIVAFALTNYDGYFELTDVKEGTYVMQFSYLGYNQLNQNVDVTGDTDMGIINMVSSAEQLEQVTIKGEHTPLLVKKDTIEYNAAAFQTQPNEVVEDLLRKMPGIEVDDDGTITAQGEEVETVLVDGKEFFGNDPKIATQNLPAESVSKIQIYDKKSDIAEFSGVDDGEREKTMNLELKEDYKQGYFGNLMAGYGIDDNENGRYEGRFSLNRFGPKLQLSAIGNINNVNKQGFSIDQFRNMMTSMGGFGRGRNSNVPLANGLSNGFTDTGAGGINMNYQISEKVKLNANYFITDISSLMESLTLRENLLDGDNNYFSRDSISSLSTNTGHNVNSRLEIDIDSTSNLQVELSLTASDPTLSSNSLSENFVEEGVFINQLNNNLESFAVEPVRSWTSAAEYKKRFGKRSISLRGSYAEGLEDLIGNQINQDFIRADRSFLYNNSNTDDDQSYQVRGSYVEPVGIGKHLEFSYRRQNFQNHYEGLVSDTELLDFEPIDSLSNFYDRDYTYDRGGVAYHLNTDASSLTIEGNLQQSRLDGDIFLPSSFGAIQTDEIGFQNTAFLPRVSYRYEFAQGHSVRINYSTSLNEPSLNQLQPNLDVSNPLNVYTGNPNLQPEYRHTTRINYFKWDQFNFRSFFAFLTATYTRDKITNQTLISQGFVETTSPVNVDDDLSVRASLSYSSPIRSIGAKYRLRSNLNFQDQIQFINGVQNDAKRYTTALTASLENRKKEKWDGEISARWSNNINTYSESDDFTQTIFNQRYSADLAVTAVKNWIFDTGIRIDIYDDRNFGTDNVVPIWTGSISRLFKEGEYGELKISAFDLLNKNLGISRTSTANFIEFQEINSLGRYFMVSYLYTLKSFGQEAAGGGRGGRGGRGGGRTRFIRR